LGSNSVTTLGTERINKENICKNLKEIRGKQGMGRKNKAAKLNGRSL
jgi:hypothetical protein